MVLFYSVDETNKHTRIPLMVWYGDKGVGEREGGKCVCVLLTK